MQYVELVFPTQFTSTKDDESLDEVIIRNAGYAPYLDYRPLSEAEQTVIETFLEKSNLPTDIEAEATNYAISHIAHQHLEEVKKHKEELIDKTLVAGALVIPVGLLQRLQGKREPQAQMFARETKRVEKLAMDAVMAAERKLGHEPQDVSSLKCGYDIESRIPETGKLRFIEVKGRIKEAETVTVTKNEILTALNKPNDYILALVEVPSSEEFGKGDV